MKQTYRVKVGWDAIIEPKLDDVVIHCDFSRFQETDDDRYLFDPTAKAQIPKSGLVLSDSCRLGTAALEAKDKDLMATRAVTLQANLKEGVEDENSENPDDYDRGDYPEVIQLCESQMELVRNDAEGNGLLTEDMIWETFHSKANIGNLSPLSGEESDGDAEELLTAMDAYATLEHVLLHEASESYHLDSVRQTTYSCD